MSSVRNLLVVVLVLTAVACGGTNINLPRANSVGSDRIDAFNKAVVFAKTLPEGRYSPSELPSELQVKNLIELHVGKGGRLVALEFPSAPIDSNPVYIHTDTNLPDAEKVLDEFCRDNRWLHLKKLDENGWYFVFGQ